MCGEDVMELQNASGITPSTTDQNETDAGSAPAGSVTTGTSTASAKSLAQAIAVRKSRHSAFSEILAQIA
jgi:hypothetical protein